MPAETPPLAEAERLREDAAREANWKRWGPYLSERQWGTVREDYSPDGDAWNYFPHDHAASRAYRWGEDGLLGICDRQCRLCFSLALWNGKDPILKERLFGLTGPEGNHGEDVKECYFYLDSTPTHSYCTALYKYPQCEYPYTWLREESARRGRSDPTPSLIDSGAFAEDRYFDVTAEYAKADTDDILARFTIVNRGPESAPLHALPTVWFRNTWIWGCKHEGCTLKPSLQRIQDGCLQADHETLERMFVLFDSASDGTDAELVFTENETNSPLLYGTDQYTPYVKDAFHRYLIKNEASAINPAQKGTKAAAIYALTLPPGGTVTLRARLVGNVHSAPAGLSADFDGADFDDIVERRKQEADAFYRHRIPSTDGEQALVARQAYAGLLWSKQFYHYIVADWLDGDKDVAQPPASRLRGRNHDWHQLYTRDVISMPDKWEYPWFAAWDLAFHMLPFARIDPDFAKQQLSLFLREWYMHPNGQLPAYEYALGDVNPPVHAWACWRVYKMTAARGQRDKRFLAAAFQKLLLNFTWWVNRFDHNGDNVFSGGFLGLDNIGIFDRSKPLPTGGHLEQADGTAWMAFYCTTMLSMALELAHDQIEYADMASKFFEHFVHITDAMNTLGGSGLWNDEDGFYYDHLRVDGKSLPIKIRSLVGLLPLIAVEVLDERLVDRLPEFRKRTKWFLQYRQDLAQHVSLLQRRDGAGAKLLLAIPGIDRLRRLLAIMLDEHEFLSPFGIRSLSKYHEQHPVEFTVDGQRYTVGYNPGESDSEMFGGNSNWRGPVWFPINFLLIEALERYYHFYGDDFQVECPTGSGISMNLREVAAELTRRLSRLFLSDESGTRPCHGCHGSFATDPHWRDLVLFHEYFHGDTGQGLGASHQTGWTALIANCIEKLGKR